MDQLPYPLRAHHGMCAAFFRGKGYSDEFTAHMAIVIRRLESNPPVLLSAQTDVICAKCPNNRGGVCDTAEKVLEYDRQVLSLTGLSEGDVMPYAEFRRAVNERILLPGRREEICGDCQWSSLCRFREET